MNMNLFKQISIRGRVAYGISCLHTYAAKVYPSEDFSSVLDLACQITEETDYIDISSQKYMEIILEYLYEFDNYEEADFEYLSEEAYKHFINLIPADDNDLNLIMHAIWQIAWEYCYNSIDKYAKGTFPYLKTIISIMERRELNLPSISRYKIFSFDINEGWGDFINRKEYI